MLNASAIELNDKSAMPCYGAASKPVLMETGVLHLLWCSGVVRLLKHSILVQVLLNAGVFGGSKAAVQDLLAGMLAEFAYLYGRVARQGLLGLSNFDMAVLNTVVLQDVARTWHIFTGRPFCAGQVR